MQANLLRLAMLYRQKIIGDSYIDAMDSKPAFRESKNQANPPQPSQSTIAPKAALTPKDIPSPHDMHLQRLASLSTKVATCNLCSLSSMVRDGDRFCACLPRGNLPTLSLLASRANKAARIESPKSEGGLRLAFVLDSIRLQRLGDSIDCLEQNRGNLMLQNIITKALGLELDSIFIFPLLKCAAMHNNMAISLRIQKETLAYERRSCIDYLLFQLEFMDSAIFFGERLCFDLFGVGLDKTKGQILDLRLKEKTIKAVCVQDTQAMMLDPALKRETLLNLNLLCDFLVSKRV